MKAIDIMHRQMVHLSILLTEVQKQILNQQNESYAAMNTRRLFALEQLVNVTNWIHDFDPQNVNFMNMSLPANLKTLDEYSRVAVKDYPKPNRIVEVQRDTVDMVSNSHTGGGGGGMSSFTVHVKSIASQQAMRKKDRVMTQSFQGGQV